MRKIVLVLSISVVLTIKAFAQTRAEIRIDSLATADIINPAIQKASQAQAEPNWSLITKDVTTKFGAVTADRTVTRAQIFLYYGKNWPKFTAAITNYTEKFEDQKNPAVLDKNANFILQRSNNPDEVRTAMTWAKKAIALDSSNEAYANTLKALEARFRKE